MDKILFWFGALSIIAGSLLFEQHQIGGMSTEGIGLILLAWGIVATLRGLMV